MIIDYITKIIEILSNIIFRYIHMDKVLERTIMYDKPVLNLLKDLISHEVLKKDQYWRFTHDNTMIRAHLGMNYYIDMDYNYFIDFFFKGVNMFNIDFYICEHRWYWFRPRIIKKVHYLYKDSFYSYNEQNILTQIPCPSDYLIDLITNLTQYTALHKLWILNNSPIFKNLPIDMKKLIIYE